jgi:hypothetical protein
VGLNGFVRDHPRTKQFDACASIHLALQHLQPIDLTFGLPVAPGLGDRVANRLEDCLVSLAGVLHRIQTRAIRDGAGGEALRRHLKDLIVYLESNQAALVNYGARRRRVEPISTAFVENAVNEIVSRRLIKKQQMRWSRWTVQPFLNVRTAALIGTLEGSFRRDYPDFRPANTNRQTMRAA